LTFPETDGLSKRQELAVFIIDTIEARQLPIESTVFAQVMTLLPLHEFRKCVERYHGNRKVQTFKWMDQFLCMAFAQLTYRESLRDIATCLCTIKAKLYHMGIRARVARSTLADANENRDWRIYADGKLHDANVLDILVPQPGAFYVMDRGDVDFKRLYAFQQAQAFFVTRAKRRMQFQRGYSHPVDKSTGVRSDQTLMLTGVNSARDYPRPLRRIRYVDPETGKRLTFLTSNFTLPALIIAQLYKARWRQETAGALAESLPNSTDLERDSFRENAHFTGVFRAGNPNRRS
jgi:hypothetical protein